MKKVLLFVILSFTLSNILLAQQFEIGPKMSYNQFQIFGNSRIDKWLVLVDEYADEGTSIGIFLRKNFKKLYAQIELQYTNNWEQVGIQNTNVLYLPEQVVGDDTLYSFEVRSIGGPDKFRRLEIPMMVGCKLFQLNKQAYLRINLGVLSAIKFRETESYGITPTNPNLMYYQVNRHFSVLEASHNNYHTLTLDYILGGGIDIWKFTFDVRYIRSLTNLSTRAEFEGKTYSLVRRAAQLSFSIGYKFNLKTPKTKSQ
jgi:hypothetical protein